MGESEKSTSLSSRKFEAGMSSLDRGRGRVYKCVSSVEARRGVFLWDTETDARGISIESGDERIVVGAAADGIKGEAGDRA